MDNIQQVLFYQSFLISMISFLLLNAILPKSFRDIRRVYLVSQTLWMFLRQRSYNEATGQTSIANVYVNFAVTALFLYFFHTHEYTEEIR